MKVRSFLLSRLFIFFLFLVFIIIWWWISFDSARSNWKILNKNCFLFFMVVLRFFSAFLFQFVVKLMGKFYEHVTCSEFFWLKKYSRKNLFVMWRPSPCFFNFLEFSKKKLISKYENERQFSVPKLKDDFILISIGFRVILKR